MIEDYSFPTFVRRYTDGTIAEDAAWRAYDIESTVTNAKARSALKSLNYRGSYYLALSKFEADYQLPNARHLLSLWYTWHRLANGTTARCKLREQDDG